MAGDLPHSAQDQARNIRDLLTVTGHFQQDRIVRQAHFDGNAAHHRRGRIVVIGQVFQKQLHAFHKAGRHLRDQQHQQPQHQHHADQHRHAALFYAVAFQCAHRDIQKIRQTNAHKKRCENV